jgi:molybdopterin-guanine dinucleotide biosynthesis protein A
VKTGISAVILAGGGGRRMEGRDKGLIPLWGEPMVSHVIARIAPQVDEVHISANRNLERYRAFGYPVIRDQDGDFSGPLAGIAAAMAVSASARLLVVPCDAPCLPRDLCMRFHTALQQSKGTLAVAHDGVRMQNAISLLPISLYDDVRACLDRGEFRLEAFLRRHAPVVVDFSDEAAAFLNVNSMEELEQLQRAGTCPGS